MSYTNGAATSDDVTATGSLNINLDGHIVMGWWRPTTLTAGRVYWGASAATNLQIHTTTSEISARFDRTVDGIWNSSGAGIVVDVWHFIAFARLSVTGVPQMRLWVGTDDRVPAEVSITVATAGSGNISSNTNFTVGNGDNVTTVAFQGQLGQVIDHRFTPNPVTWLSVETGGVITQGEADYFLRSAVIPMWQAKPPPFIGSGTTSCMNLIDLETVGNPILRCYQRGATIRVTPEEISTSRPWDLVRQPRPLNGWPLPACPRR